MGWEGGGREGEEGAGGAWEREGAKRGRGRTREVACDEALKLVGLNEASRHPARKARATPVGQGFVFGGIAPDELHLLRTL